MTTPSETSRLSALDLLREFDVQRVRVGKIVELHGRNLRCGNALCTVTLSSSVTTLKYRRAANLHIHTQFATPSSLFIVYTINGWTFRSTRRKMRATLPCMAFRLRGLWISNGTLRSTSRTLGVTTVSGGSRPSGTSNHACTCWSTRHEKAGRTSSAFGRRTSEKYASMKTKRKTKRVRTDPDSPAWTAEDFRRARPAREVLPEIFGKAMAEGCCDREGDRRVRRRARRYLCVCRRTCSLAGRPKVQAGRRAWWKCSPEASSPRKQLSSSRPATPRSSTPCSVPS